MNFLSHHSQIILQFDAAYLLGLKTAIISLAAMFCMCWTGLHLLGFDIFCMALLHNKEAHRSALGSACCTVEERNEKVNKWEEIHKGTYS
jgi:hypothetical protein